MQTITVIIQEGGLTCREVNTISIPNNMLPTEENMKRYGEWAKVEYFPRIFEIESVIVDGEEIIRDGADPRDKDSFLESFPTGKEYQAQILENSKVRIV